MLALQAALVGIFSYLAAIEAANPLGTTGSFYCLGRPLVAGLVLGLIFGDVTQGVLCGVAVQAVFIANLSTGGATNAEISYASYAGMGLAMATTKDPAIAVTLSVLVGNSFGLIFYNLRMAFYSVINNKEYDAAAAGDTKALNFWHIVVSQICTFLIRFLPAFIAVYFGQGFVDVLISSVPELVTHMIQVLGGVLPALGVGMLMNIVVKEKTQLVFFFLGFVLFAFAGLGTIPVVFIAAVVAYLVYLASGKSAAGEVLTSSADAAYEDADLF
ncbi:PTS sugar transporter subunit IIC [Thermophilibacter immobilis]|uniref:PTS sugar transporter subunit IIC n=1 Tax=Thermophilibacter immobilis TaxID=2779519 RepID=A0A7S7RUM9_9ACTN|nr:PTS sugar transporter subunit IIC [Thermophilibacter immobilis]QOY60439.1 PTS sugar transporter subunit IIC [Thermophilibacter immobilis]